MADALTYLTYLGVILLIGLITTVISNKIKVPNVLLLIFIGIIIGKIQYAGAQLIAFEDVFITGLGILALILIVFDSTSKLNLKEFDHLSFASLKLIGIFIVLSLLIVGTSTKYLTGVSWGVAILFSSLVVGTSPDIVFAIMHDTKNKVMQLLEIEAILNTPLTVLLPFIILDFIRSVKTDLIITKFIDQLAPFLQQIVAGIGSGMLVGLIIFKIMRKWYSEKLSPLILLSASLLAYILAENLRTAGDSVGGNGILAVTTLGLFWGAVRVRQKVTVRIFSSLLSNALEIIVFVLIGLIINIPLTALFILSSFGLFIIYIMVRYLSIQFAFKNEYDFKQKLFMAGNASKGIAVAVVALVLTRFTNIPGIDVVTNLVLVFMIYSIILASMLAFFSRYFLNVKIKEEV